MSKFKDLEEWWATEPFGFDHPDTKAGIEALLESREKKIEELTKIAESFKEAYSGLSTALISDREEYRREIKRLKKLINVADETLALFYKFDPRFSFSYAESIDAFIEYKEKVIEARKIIKEELNENRKN